MIAWTLAVNQGLEHPLHLVSLIFLSLGMVQMNLTVPNQQQGPALSC